MVRYLLFFSFSLIFSHATLATCKTNNSLLGAKYKITKNQLKDNATSIRHLTLWRNGKQVAQQYLDTGITEMWEQTSNGQLRLVRYFDKHQRGIEYLPNEINNGIGTKNWDVKNQLITNKLIQSMELKSRQGKGCKKIESYTLKTNNKRIKLDWLAEPRLLKTYSETSATEKVKWELVNIITEPKKIHNVFSIRADYQTTDYIDIGDNESDPFLMKMINLGFVEHTASGFYDAKGNTLGGHHH